MKHAIAPLTLSLLTAFGSLHAASPDAGFTAYHTRMNPSPVGDIGKYEDLVVTFGETNRLEYARANGYQPRWRTASGVHPVDMLVPGTSEDPNGNYSQVRLIEHGPDKIVVHWRHFRDVAMIDKANAALDPVNPRGITEVIALTVSAWVALDTYPYNNAPLVHHSKGFGAQGWYLGLDAYGHPFITVAGQTVKASGTVLPLYQWSQVSAAIGSGVISLHVDGREVASGELKRTLTTPDTALLLGRNNVLERNTDPVRRPKHNLQILYGIQGLLDEIRIHGEALSPDQVRQAYTAMAPADRASDLAKGSSPRRSRPSSTLASPSANGGIAASPG